MPWGVVAAAVVGAYSANQSAKAGEKGAQAQQDAANAATAEERRQYDQTREDRQPYMQAGTNALTQMQQLNSGDFSSFKASPDYQFNVDQQMQGLDRSAAARGGLYSGGADADRMKMMSGLASQQYGTYYSRLSDLATGGNATAGALGQLGGQMAGSIGNNMMNGANARASAYANTANSWGNAANQTANAAGSWYGSLGRDSQGAYLGNNRGRG